MEVWENLVKTTCGPDYVMIRSHTLGPTNLMLLAHKSVLPLVSEVASSSVPTGVGNLISNKGGVGISLTVTGIRLLFVT